MLLNLVIILGLMFLAWLASLPLHDASIIDRLWGVGFVALAAAGHAVGEGGARQMLLLLLVSLWGVRLSVHITWRNWGKPEDRRYVAMRSHHGGQFWWRSLFTVFFLQAALLWFIALPVQVTMNGGSGSFPTPQEFLGTAVALAGIAMEATADFQLASFKRNPENAGQVMDKGLWRYSRHPNYFGDALTWWGFYLFSCGTPLGPYTLLSPLLMTWLLRRVSGVPLLEADLLQRRPAYADYVRRTSAFVPRPPRKRYT